MVFWHLNAARIWDSLFKYCLHLIIITSWHNNGFDLHTIDCTSTCNVDLHHLLYTYTHQQKPLEIIYSDSPRQYPCLCLRFVVEGSQVHSKNSALHYSTLIIEAFMSTVGREKQLRYLRCFYFSGGACFTLIKSLDMKQQVSFWFGIILKQSCFTHQVEIKHYLLLPVLMLYTNVE